VVPGADYNGTPRISLTVQQPVGSVGPASVMNFSTLFASYEQRSAALATCPSTLVLTNANSMPIPQPVPPGTNAFVRLTPGITNVLDIAATDLNNVTTLNFPTPPSASTPLLINVSTASIGGTFTWTPPNFAGAAGPQAQFVLLNFPGATQITQVLGSTVEGTIFAPDAQLTDLSASNNEGNIVVAGYQQGAPGANGGEVHVFPFAGALTCQCQ
jgi:choice-of-anchor A domain-containing protein